MSRYRHLNVEDRGPARVVAIDRPAVRNALSEALLDELTSVVEETARGRTMRGLVLTGAGDRAFAAGADIGAMVEMTQGQALVFAGKAHGLAEMLGTLPIPVIAAVRGYALGGGCELALACDFIYASPDAKFAQPEVRLGVIPGFGGTQRLTRRVGAARALELCMTGETIDATEALRIGLVNKVVEAERLVETAVRTVETIAEMGPLAVARVKDVIREGSQMALADGLLVEQQAFAQLFATADQQEGMRAFLDKRKPAFSQEVPPPMESVVGAIEGWDE